MKVPLTGPLLAPAVLAGLLDLPSATFEGLAGPLAAALPSGFLPPGGAMGSPGPLAKTARMPMERPLGSIKGSSASTLALNKRPGRASIFSSTTWPGDNLAW